MDSKFSVSRVWRIACIEFYKWITNPRMITAAAMIIFIWSFAVEPLMRISREMDSPLNFAEPFIAVFNSRVLCLVAPAVYIFLVSDYPRLDRNGLFVLHRANKTEWLSGQFIFFVFTVLMYNGLILICSVIPDCMNAFAADGWSLAVTRYGVYNPQKSSSFAASLITEELYNQISPYRAMAASFALNSLYMLLLALILLLFHVFNCRKMGVPSAISIIGLGSAMGIFKSSGMWFFPMPHTMISLHYTKYLREPVMELRYSFLYFAGLITIIFIVCLSAVKHTDFLNIDEND